MKKYILSFVGVLALAATAVAGTNSKNVTEVVETSKFRDTELQIDAFGLGAFYQSGRPGWGGGLGVNYFFGRYFGLGVEQDVFGRSNNGSLNYTEWGTFGNAFLRYPIDSWNIAPYGLVGGGVIYGSRVVGGGTVGGGFEYRLTDNFGLFGDARWLYTEDNNGVLARTGIKLAF
jgi:hypothetical protein